MTLQEKLRRIGEELVERPPQLDRETTDAYTYDKPNCERLYALALESLAERLCDALAEARKVNTYRDNCRWCKGTGQGTNARGEPDACGFCHGHGVPLP